MDTEERLKKIEERLDRIEKHLAIEDEYIKDDIRGDLAEKQKIEELEEEIRFIDEKIERKG